MRNRNDLDEPVVLEIYDAEWKLMQQVAAKPPMHSRPTGWRLRNVLNRSIRLAQECTRNGRVTREVPRTCRLRLIRGEWMELNGVASHAARVRAVP
jgi:hypothetical protein